MLLVVGEGIEKGEEGDRLVDCNIDFVEVHFVHPRIERRWKASPFEDRWFVLAHALAGHVYIHP